MLPIFERLSGEFSDIDLELRNYYVSQIEKTISDLRTQKTELTQARNSIGLANTNMDQELADLKSQLKMYKDEGDEAMAQMIQMDIDDIESKIKTEQPTNDGPKYDKEKFSEINAEIKRLELEIEQIKSGEKDINYAELGDWTKSDFNRGNFSFDYNKFTTFVDAALGEKYTPELMKLKNKINDWVNFLGIKLDYNLTIDNFYKVANKLNQYVEELLTKKREAKKELADLWSEDLENYILNFVDSEASYDEIDSFVNLVKTILNFKYIRPNSGVDLGLGNIKGGARLGVALEKNLLKYITDATKGKDIELDSSVEDLKNDPKKSMGGMKDKEYFKAIYNILKKYTNDFGGGKFNEDNRKDQIKDESKNKSNDPIDFIFNGVGYSLKRFIDGSSSIKLLDLSNKGDEIPILLKVISKLQKPNNKFGDKVWVEYSSGEIINVYTDKKNINPAGGKIEEYPLKKNLKLMIDKAFRVPHHLMLVHKNNVIFVNFMNIAKNINLKSFIYPNRNVTSKDTDGYFKFDLKKASNMVVYRISDQIAMTRVQHTPKMVDDWSWDNKMDIVRKSKIINKLDNSNNKKRYAVKEIIMRVHAGNKPNKFKFRINLNLSMVNKRLLEQNFIPSYGDLYLKVNEIFNKKSKDPKMDNIYREYKEQAKNFHQMRKQVKNKIAKRIFSMLGKTARSTASIFRQLSTAKADDKKKDLMNELQGIRKGYNPRANDLDKEAIESVKRLSDQLDSNVNPDRAEKLSDSIEDLQKAVVSLRKFKV